MNGRLARFLAWRNQLAAVKSISHAVLGDEAMDHTRFADRPNLYEEHDIGMKKVRYPDGTVRRVPARKVKDTAGTAFYVFGEETRLQ